MFIPITNQQIQIFFKAQSINLLLRMGNMKLWFYTVCWDLQIDVTGVCFDK